MKPTLDVIPPGRRGGRPRTDDNGKTISTRVRAADHDRVIRLANAHGVTVAEILRAIIRRS